jgi:Mrp family chromosome partitioning ATPase
MRLRSLEPSYRDAEQPPHFVVEGEVDRSLPPLTSLPLDPQLTAANSPSDTLAQATRNLRAMIATARLSDGRPPRLIVLLSAEADPETALTAGNLAIASARSGWRTLLVDTSDEEAVQTRLFHLDQRPAAAPLDEVADLGTFVQRTAVSDLFLLSVGSSSPAGSGGMVDPHRFLDPLTEDFDLLLIDASHTSADCALTAAADAAILVLRRDHSTVSCVGEMINRLRTQGVPLLGTFLVA